jgi:hypothetical protein
VARQCPTRSAVQTPARGRRARGSSARLAAFSPTRPRRIAAFSAGRNVAARVDVLLAALDEYGMSASTVSAAELIQERVQWVAAHLRVRPATARRYLTDGAVRDLARIMAVTVADEAPGADVLASPAWPRGPLRMPGTDRPPEPSNLL